MTPRRIIMVVCLVIFFAGSFYLRRSENIEPQPNTTQALPSRIISMAPSITETIYELGLQGKLVGVTNFCDYPEEALRKTKIGGYFDQSYEMILKLKPDLIVLLPEHVKAKKHMSQLHLPWLEVCHREVDDILESILSIGEKCGASDRAQELVGTLKKNMLEIQTKTKNLKKLRVMMTVGRNMGSGTIEDVYIAGSGGFYSQLIEMAGGVNVYEGSMSYPVVSAEGILSMNPDVIIDMIPDLVEKSFSLADVLQEWKKIHGVQAIENDRIFVIGEGYISIPGPRFILILQDFAKALHPEIKWNFKN